MAEEKRTLRIWRGNREGGEFTSYEVETFPGMGVLAALNDVQAKTAPDLAVRWNCKAGRCGSCSAEINGKPKLLCMTRMAQIAAKAAEVVDARVASPHARPRCR